jgi:hypothetical protein
MWAPHQAVGARRVTSGVGDMPTSDRFSLSSQRPEWSQRRGRAPDLNPPAPAPPRTGGVGAANSP